MNILTIEPYYDGSHKAFIDGWRNLSSHKLHLLTMPGYKWKWRMRGSAIEMAQQANWLCDCGHKFDAVFCSDMLNVAEFCGLIQPALAKLPRIVYFHENQITYPCRFQQERDYQFAITNITTALAASQVWFNSDYHKNDFLTAASGILNKMPDYKCLNSIEAINKKSIVVHPCINDCRQHSSRSSQPMHIIWAARWEHDKNPDDFFTALGMLKDMGINFKVSVTGQSFRDTPPIFENAKSQFADHLINWGFLPDVAAYQKALSEADVFVSTATHEFFGISAVEAAAAGCCVLVPNRLAYPEVFNGIKGVLYDGSCKDLTCKLAELSANPERLECLAKQCTQISQKYLWQNNISFIDELAEKITGQQI